MPYSDAGVIPELGKKKGAYSSYYTSYLSFRLEKKAKKWYNTCYIISIVI